MFIENIGNLDQGAYNAAKHAVNTYYNQPVVTDITQKLAQPMNPPLNNKTPLQAMSIEVGPNGVKFVPNGDYDPMAAFTMRASEKALNDLIIANAHLDGTKDYKAYWEKNRGYLFPSLYGHPDVLKVGDIVYGKKFLGGLVNDPKNWEKTRVTIIVKGVLAASLLSAPISLLAGLEVSPQQSLPTVQERFSNGTLGHGLWKGRQRRYWVLLLLRKQKQLRSLGKWTGGKRLLKPLKSPSVLFWRNP